ncbi:MAG: hypothetical protein SPI74_04570 [Eubacterium sp.]|nr:hypothetical protein [Eubacterium sp.]
MNMKNIVKYIFYSLSAIISVILVLSFIIIFTVRKFSSIADIMDFIFKYYFVYILVIYLIVAPLYFIYRYQKYKNIEPQNIYISARKFFIIASLIALELNIAAFAVIVFAFYHPEVAPPIPFEPNVMFIACLISLIAWVISLVITICSFYLVKKRGQ